MQNNNASVYSDERVDMGQEGMVTSLLTVNRLLFNMPPEIGVAQKKTMNQYFSTATDYGTGGAATLTFQIQSGSDYVDGLESYMVIPFQTLGTTPRGNFGCGSVLNCFRNITLKYVGGQEISKTDWRNVLNANLMRYWNSPEYLNTIGAAFGVDQDPVNWGATSADLSVLKKYVVPLTYISGLFCSEHLIPPHYLSGARIDIELEPVDSVIVSRNSSVTGYKILSPYLMLQCYTLESPFEKALNDKAAKNGLILLWKEWANTINSGTFSLFNIDVQKACSKALMAVAIERGTGFINVPASDSFLPLKYDLLRQRSNIGSHYFPSIELQTSVTDFNESYIYTQQNWGKTTNSVSPNAVTPTQYGDVSPVGATGTNLQNGISSLAIVSTNFNRSNGATDYAGYVVNNSLRLVYRLQFANSATSKQIDVFLQFLRAGKAYLNNIDIKD